MSRKLLTEADRRRTRRSLLLWTGMGAVLVLLGGVVYVLVGYLRVNATPPPPPEAKLADEATALYGKAPTASIDDQLEQVAKAVREGRNGSFEIGMRPADLQATLSRRLQDQQIEGLKVYFGDGVVVLQGKVTLAQRRLWATVRVTPRIENGQLMLDVTDAQLGTQPMWAGVREQLQREICKALAGNSPGQTGVWLDSAAVSPYRMTVQGHTQPTQQR